MSKHYILSIVLILVYSIYSIPIVSLKFKPILGAAEFKLKGYYLWSFLL